jgi:hypothetical protein
MIVVTLSEKVVVVSSGDTFYGKVLVGNNMTLIGDDCYQIEATGFISIVKDLVEYNPFKNGKIEKVNTRGVNIEGVQVDADIKGVPT